MSEIQSSNSSDLTAYNVDGLELHFTANRKVRASQSAIARMCTTDIKVVAQGQISQLIKKLTEKGELKNDVLKANIVAGTRLQGHLLYSAATIVACLNQYNPERLNDYMEFGINEGLAQMAGVPLPTVTKVVEGYKMPDNVAILEMALQLAKEDRNRQSFLSDKPGLKAMDDIAKADRGLALPGGKFIVREVSEEMGLTLTQYQSSGLSGMVANAVFSQNLNQPTKRFITYGKRKQGYWVNEYNYDVKGVVLDCMKHMKLI